MVRSELDKQLDLRATVPEFETYIAEFIEKSEKLRGEYAFSRIAYGPHERNFLDFFPGKGGDAPLLLFIHGGYWRAFSANDFSFVARPYLERGWAVAIGNYRLAPEVTMTEIADDVSSLIAYLGVSGKHHGYDDGAVSIIGHSAGAHLASLALCRSGLPARIRALALLSGIFDLDPLKESFLQDVLNLREKEVEQLSPARLAPAFRMPVNISVGGDETDFFRCESEKLHTLLLRQQNAILTKLDKRDHFSILKSAASSCGEIYTWIVAHGEGPRFGHTERA